MLQPPINIASRRTAREREMRTPMEKKPFATKEQLEAIAAQFPTPFHLYDEAGIRRNMEAMRDAFAWNPGFREYFAVKATPNPFLINILREYGCGCDCATGVELMLADVCGAHGHDLMFSSNETPAADYALADKLGAIINLDDITHIDFLEQTIGHIPETISCRYNPGGLFKISNGIMDNPGDAKYGMTTEQLFEAFRILAAKGAKNFGIHAFLCSNTVTNDYYPELAKVLFNLAVRLQEETGAHIAFINLSGGVGIPYSPDQEPNDIRVIGEGVRRVYEEVLVPAGMDDVAIYTELGRFMMGPYGCLVTRAIHEKHIYKEYIGVDACAANLMRPAIYGAYHHITVAGKEDWPCDHTYDVVGGLCENNDKFAIDRALPRIDMGDLLVIHDTGAHGHSMGYNYNGKLRSAEVLLREDGSAQLIRRAETPADYFATLDCFPEYADLSKRH
jgi:diaminopimelate decarboxylase